MGVVDRRQEDVVPLGRHRLPARHPAQVRLQPLRRQGPAEQPTVGLDRLGDVDAEDPEVVGDPAAVEVDEKDEERWPPVAQEVEVLPRRPPHVPGDGREPEKDDDLVALSRQAAEVDVGDQPHDVRREADHPDQVDPPRARHCVNRHAHLLREGG